MGLPANYAAVACGGGVMQFRDILAVLDDIRIGSRLTFQGMRIIRLDETHWMLNGMRCRREGCAALIHRLYRVEIEALLARDRYV